LDDVDVTATVGFFFAFCILRFIFFFYFIDLSGFFLPLRYL
jgi:hypothetical protein